MDRPKLTDPEEFEIVKSMYVTPRPNFNDEIDPLEQLERSNSRFRSKNNSSR